MTTEAVWLSRETSKDLTPAKDVSGVEGQESRWPRTVELLEDTLNCAGAAAASHGDVEVVCVVRHGALLRESCLEGLSRIGKVQRQA